MFWGDGPTLGLPTVCGYVLFLFGAVVVQRNRDNFLLWIQDEISFFHRSFSRFRSVPHCLLNSLSRSRIQGGPDLRFFGLRLLLFDLFV